jgi:alanine-synthesizing transaminase
MKQFIFSDRFNEIGLGEEENALTKIKNQKIKEGTSVLDLINSNPTSVGLYFPSNVISHNMDEKTVSDYTPSEKGLFEARLAISDYYNKKGVYVNADDLILTSSTSESYSYLFKLLTNPGDEILIPAPGYPLFSFLTQFENIKSIEYPLEESNNGQWNYSLTNLKSSLTSKTKAVILVNPANPTGSHLSQEEWQEWIHWSSQTQIPLLVDEVFSPYFLEDETSYVYPNSISAPIFILNGISKLLALPQMKLGWIHVNGDTQFKKKAISGLELLADTYLSVNLPIQKILPELLKWSPIIQNQIRNRIKRNLAEARANFAEDKTLTWRNGNAGWYAWLEIKADRFNSSEEVAERLLLEKNIYIHPGDWYGFDANRLILVLSLIIPEDQFLGGIKELTSFLR